MSSKKNIKWSTPSIVKVYKEELTASPTNLRNAFQAVSSRLGIAFSTASRQWYCGDMKALTGIQVKTASRNQEHLNVKNTPRKASEISNGQVLQEKVISTKRYPGLRVVTIRQYFAA